MAVRCTCINEKIFCGWSVIHGHMNRVVFYYKAVMVFCLVGCKPVFT